MLDYGRGDVVDGALMRKKRVIQAGKCYHLVSRVAHRAYFFDDEEKDRFVLVAQGGVLRSPCLRSQLRHSSATGFCARESRPWAEDCHGIYSQAYMEGSCLTVPMETTGSSMYCVKGESGKVKILCMEVKGR